MSPRFVFLRFLALSAALALAFVVPVQAGTVTWDFTACSSTVNNANLNGCTPSSFSNATNFNRYTNGYNPSGTANDIAQQHSRTFIATSGGGEVLHAAAFSATVTDKSSGSNTLAQVGKLNNALLGMWDGYGMGVFSNYQDEHYVDNAGTASNGTKTADFIVFHFARSDYNPVEAILRDFGASNSNPDIQWWVGGTEADYKSGTDYFAGFTGQTLQSVLTKTGTVWEEGIQLDGALVQSDPETRGYSLVAGTKIGSGGTGTGTGQYLILAGRLFTDSTDPNKVSGSNNQRNDIDDKFKLQGLRGSISTPEPATLALFGVGLAGLAWVRRARKRR